MAAPKCPALCPLPCPVHLPEVITALICFHHSLNTCPSPSDTPPGEAPGSAGTPSARAGSGHIGAGVSPGCASPWGPPGGRQHQHSSTNTCRTQGSVDTGAVTAPRQGHHPPRPPSGPQPLPQPQHPPCGPQFPSQYSPSTQCHHPLLLHSPSASQRPQTPAHQLRQPLPVPRQQYPLDPFLAQGRQGQRGGHRRLGRHSWIPGGS